jgi:hypothetical protein
MYFWRKPIVMIPIQEVRYGNLGQVSGMVYEYSIGPNGDPHPFFWRRHEDGFFECASLDKIEPIPITPEWLERLGCIVDEDEYRFELPDKKTVIVFGKNEMHCELGHFYSEVTTYMPYNKYVHQFQNLYHSLTGQELTVKQPETI